MKQISAIRIAIVDRDYCKSDKCNFECNRFCPIVRAGKNIVVLDDQGKAVIDEIGCIGCGICAEKCPFHAIDIINLATEPNVPCVHQYGPNAFRLYGLPVIRYGKATGMIGMNGAGKSTAINILAKKLYPNLGYLDKRPEFEEIIAKFKGSEIHRYLKDLYDNKIRVALKPQDIHEIPLLLKGTVRELLKFAENKEILEIIKETLGITKFLDRKISLLSGGELQLFAITFSLSKEADIYFLDEPCSYLDVHQRLKLTTLLDQLLEKGKTMLLVEHDFSILDYLCDTVCIVYGKPKAYGMISLPYSTNAGINAYFEGFLPHENVRIRKTPIRFQLRKLERVSQESYKYLVWSNLKIKIGDFSLNVEEGFANKGEVLGILGPNGIGKTTFIKAIVGEIKDFEGEIYTTEESPKLSYKPQVFSFEDEGKMVKDHLISINKEYAKNEWIIDEIIKPLRIDQIFERKIEDLSGGEKQALMVASTLLKEADMYVLDEPSAFLDVEQRLTLAKLLKKYAQTFRKLVMVVEHDLIIQDFAVDSIMVFKGIPASRGYATSPLSLKEGFNVFLKDLGITFRRDKRTNRPRINKPNSSLDRYQKEIGEYYFIE